MLWVKFRLPPSGFSPYDTAIASINVDFPVPFSPMKNVTFGCRGRLFSRARIDGRQNGN